MYIISQKKDIIFNFSNFDMIGRNGKTVGIAKTKKRKTNIFSLGEYATEERAAEALKQMLNEAFAPPMVVLQNAEMTPECKDMVGNMVLMVKASDDQPTKIEKLEVNCWYMPEE